MIRIHAQVKFVREFKCNRCGTHAMGETERVDVEEIDLMPFQQALARAMTERSPRFPVGWASFMGPTYLCEKCLKKGTDEQAGNHPPHK